MTDRLRRGAHAPEGPQRRRPWRQPASRQDFPLVRCGCGRVRLK